MANVKLTWTDKSTNETHWKVFRLKGDLLADGSWATTPNWVHIAAPSNSAINADDTGAAISPHMTDTWNGGSTDGKATDTAVTSGGTIEYVDQNVPTGTWTYRIAAVNGAGYTWCDNPDVKVVTV